MDSTASNEADALEVFRTLGAWIAEPTKIYARGTAVSDEHVAYLRLLPQIELCVLTQTRITDAAMPTISALPNLGLLDISRTAVTDEGVSHLASLRALTNFGAYGTRITDEALRTIGALTGLSTLNLNQTSITDEGLQLLVPLRRLRVLEVLDTNVTRGGVARFQQFVPDCLVRTNDGLFKPIAPLTTE